MRKSIKFILAVLIMVLIPTGIIMAQVNSAYPQQAIPTPTPFTQPTPLPEINTYSQSASFSFADLDEPTFVMRYPSVKGIYIDFPNDWNLVGGTGYSSITLHYDFYESIVTPQIGATPHPLISTHPYISRPGVEVYLGNVLIHSFIPEIGSNQTVTIPIPENAIPLKGNNPTNQYDLSIGFYNDADIYCNYDGILTIYDDSSVNPVFGVIPPYRYLASLPVPLIQESFIPETLKLVIADSPTSADLEAVAIIASSIAQNSFGNVQFDVVRASEVTAADTEKSNIIVIGTPENNKFLASLYQKKIFPSNLSANGKEILESGRDIEANSGVLQIAPSDINEFATVATITGESDEGVLRAARAFRQLPVGTPPFLLVITEQMDSLEPAAPVVDETPNEFTFAELGFRERTLIGFGTNRALLFFYIPRDWVLEGDLKLTVDYAYSDSIESRASNAVVNLNNQPIGNLVLGEVSEQPQTIEISIPADQVLKGMMNIVQINTNLTATLICDDYIPENYWFQIFDTGTLEIPHRVTTAPVEIASVIHPTVPFAFEPKHLVVLGENPSAEILNAFANFYYQIGDLNSLVDFDVMVSLDPDVDPAEYPERNTIVIGLPTASKLFETYADKLPQPFVAGTTELQQNIAETQYALVPGANIGLIESIPAPWDYARSLTLITGTSDESLNWSIKQLLQDIYAFNGDLFFIQDTNLTSFLSTMYSKAVLDALVADVIDKEEGTALQEVASASESEQGQASVEGSFIRDEKVNATTTPIFIMAVVALLGLVFIIYFASRIASGGRKK